MFCGTQNTPGTILARAAPLSHNAKYLVGSQLFHPSGISRYQMKERCKSETTKYFIPAQSALPPLPPLELFHPRIRPARYDVTSILHPPTPRNPVTDNPPPSSSIRFDCAGARPSVQEDWIYNFGRLFSSGRGAVFRQGQLLISVIGMEVLFFKYRGSNNDSEVF